MRDAVEAAMRSLVERPRPVKLLPFLQRGGKWSWAHPTAIASFIGDDSGGPPIAEAWAGAHPDGMSRLQIDGVEVEVKALIDRHGARVLGQEVLDAFGGFPFLLKLLACGRSLSGQVHPNLQQARQGFADEQRRRALPPAHPQHLKQEDAFFTDANHKPEVALALTDFVSLYQLRPATDLRPTLDRYFPGRFPAFDGSEAGARAVFAEVLSLDQAALNEMLGPLVRHLRDEARDGRFTARDNAYWVLNDADNFGLTDDTMDPGLFLDLLLNVKIMQPGEVLFQQAGKPHCYKRGFIVELMANSNNVGRLGLTTKKIDKAGVLRVMDGNPGSYEMGAPAMSAPTRIDGPEQYFEFSGVRDFALSVITLGPGEVYRQRAEHEVEMFIVGGAESIVVTDALGVATPWRRGEFGFVPRGAAYSVTSAGGAVVYRATVPPSAQRSST